jgi:hypothetical protein
MNNLAGRYIAAGRHEEALHLDEQTFLKARASLGAHHRFTLDSMRNVADGYKELGRFDEAEALYRQSLALNKDSFSGTLALARLLLERAEKDTNGPARTRARVAEGKQLAHEALTMARARYANDRVNLEETIQDIAHLYYRHGHYSESEPLYREFVLLRSARLGAGQEKVIAANASLARLLADWAWAERNTKPEAVERARESERLLRECFAMHSEGTNAGHWRTADVKSRLGAALVSVAVTDPSLAPPAREAILCEAETLLVEGHEGVEKDKSVEKKYRRDGLERLMRLYEARGQSDKLAGWQQKLADFDATKSIPSTAAGSQ